MDENGEYICGDSDYVVHEHRASCFGEDGSLWCTLPEIKAHTHDESCYAQPEAPPVEATEPQATPTEPAETEAAPTDATEPEATTAEPTEPAEPVLTCGKEERILHTHTEECYETDEKGNARLICGRIQLLEHVHSEDCSQTVETPVDTEALTCVIAEGEGAHTHSGEAGCYDEAGELICTLEESAGHQHGPRCYGTWELTCAFEEHTHSELCMPTETTRPLELLATTPPIHQVLANGAAESESAVITPHKTIDAFRDSADNPDTDLDNQNIDQTDLYRLYLDAQLSTVNKPIDLLIIVDQSGSMHNDYQTGANGQDMTKENGADAYRDEALRLVLNGYSSDDSSTYEQHMKDGLIYQFLNANSENQVAVVGFQGHGYIYSGQYKYGSQYHYKQNPDGTLADVTSGYYQTDDSGSRIEKSVTSGIADTEGYLEAETLLPWTKEAAYVDVQGIRYNATNYTAGFIQAQRELERPAVQNNHQKVVLFLSDGIPTCYIAGQDGSYYREGDGSHDNTKGTDTATTNAFDTFITFVKNNFKATLHTVSVKAGTAETRLTNMASQGNGQCFGVSTTDDLKKSLRVLMFGSSYSELMITDNLSDYVDVHRQPDCKVTMKQQDGTMVTLYENGHTTAEGQGILQSVNCTPGGKTVEAIFEPTFKPYGGATFTLSFNVETTELAYQEHAEKGYGGVKGDQATDYGENKTSSEQDGFHSNKTAILHYKDGTQEVNKPYPHPVVQVTDRELVVKKQWLAYDSTDVTLTQVGTIDFVLHQLANPVDPTVPTATVTVSRDYYGSLTQEISKTLEIDSQATLTFQKGSGWLSRIRSFKVNGQEISLASSGDTYTYTFTVSQDTVIVVEYSGSKPTNFNLSVVPPPKAEWPIDNVYKGGTISSSGGWQTVYKNLPKSGRMEDTNGKMTDVLYTYYVEELSVEGYKTTYDNNGGILQGTVTITNQSTTPSTHVLPSTGGTGTKPYTIGGLLILSIAVLLLYSNKKHGKEDVISS